MRTRPKLRLAAMPALFVLGAVLGTAWDELHVQAGTLRYSRPTIGGEVWWVPLEFGLLFAIGAYLVVALGDPAPRRSSPKAVLVEGVWLTAVYTTTAFADRRPWVLFAILVALALVRIGDLSVLARANPIPAITLVVLGPVTERLLVEADLFRYRSAQLGGIPAWLPLLYLHAIPFMVRLTEAALYRWGVRRGAEPATAVVSPNGKEPVEDLRPPPDE